MKRMCCSYTVGPQLFTSISPSPRSMPVFVCLLVHLYHFARIPSFVHFLHFSLRKPLSPCFHFSHLSADYFYYKEHLFIVCELLRDNLYEFYKYNRNSGDELYFTLPRLKRVAKQCLMAMSYIHSLNLIHCDLKPENILIKSYSRCEVKIIDFGSSCFTNDSLGSYVQSRAYRAPEVRFSFFLPLLVLIFLPSSTHLSVVWL
jgi:serine/threonine protein kinase